MIFNLRLSLIRWISATNQQVENSSFESLSVLSWGQGSMWVLGLGAAWESRALRGPRMVSRSANVGGFTFLPSCSSPRGNIFCWFSFSVMMHFCVFCVELQMEVKFVFFFCQGSGFHTPSLSKSRPAVCPLRVWFILVPPGMCLYNLLIPGTWMTLA